MKTSANKTNHLFKRYSIENIADLEQAMVRLNEFCEAEDAKNCPFR